MELYIAYLDTNPSSSTGDEYRVTMLKSLMPQRTFPPANYDPASRRLLSYPSTMDDVADFVTEYITSDVSSSDERKCLRVLNKYLVSRDHRLNMANHRRPEP